jgi:hypothetical protein
MMAADLRYAALLRQILRVTALHPGRTGAATADEPQHLHRARPRGVPPHAGERRIPAPGHAGQHRGDRRALADFYDTIREPGPLTITSDYASSVVRRFFDARSPLAEYIAIPQSL